MDQHLRSCSLETCGAPLLVDGAVPYTLPDGPAHSFTEYPKSVTGSHAREGTVASAVSLQSIVPTSWDKIIDGATAQQDCKWMRAEHPDISESEGMAAAIGASGSHEVDAGNPQHMHAAVQVSLNSQRKETKSPWFMIITS